MPDAVMLSEFAGIGMPDWIDALIRLVFIVALMTINALALIYLERKVLARFQARVGPTRTGPMGILQSLADAIKLLTKEDVAPRLGRPLGVRAGGVLRLRAGLPDVRPHPLHGDLVHPRPGTGLPLRLRGAGTQHHRRDHGRLGSDNKYALLGGIRAAAQAISYELPMLLAAAGVIMIAAGHLQDDGLVGGALNLNFIAGDQRTTPYIVLQPLGFVIFMIGALAELHRPPFDMPVAESEVVGGYFVEYSGIRWSLFFLAEYTGLFLMVMLASTVFLGGWNFPYGEDAGWACRSC